LDIKGAYNTFERNLLWKKRSRIGIKVMFFDHS